jgi:hypothetical protein
LNPRFGEKQVKESTDTSREQLEAKEAECIEALANVDIADLVKRLEQDSKDGAMSAGQRKTAHLLLSYYAPRKSAEPTKTLASQPLAGLPVTTILSIIQQIDQRLATTGSNTDQPLQVIDSNGEPPSLSKTNPSAGVLLEQAVSTDSPRSNMKNSQNNPSKML